LEDKAKKKERRERIALEYVRALLSGPHAFLFDKPAELAEKAVQNADALIARLDRGEMSP
jgi:hypothetical protein